MDGRMSDAGQINPALKSILDVEVDRRPVTADDLLALVGEGLTGKNLVEFLKKLQDRSRKPAENGKKKFEPQSPEAISKAPATIEEAVTILGKKHVHTEEETSYVWGIKANSDFGQVLYTRERLQAVAEENASGEGEWHFLYLFGLMTYEMQQKRGEWFSGLSEWLRNSQGFMDLRRVIREGYSLINFRPQYPGLGFQMQERQVIGSRHLIRPHDSTVIEAVLALQMLTNQRPLLQVKHLGYTENRGARIVIESALDGIRLTSAKNGSNFRKDLGVALMALPDCVFDFASLEKESEIE